MGKEVVLVLIIAGLTGIAFGVQAHLKNFKQQQIKEFEKKIIPPEKFMRIFNQVKIQDPEVKNVWDCMQEALGHEAYGELILEMLLSLTGVSALSGFNEFWINDQDFGDKKRSKKDTVCLNFKGADFYCSKTKLISAYHSLLRALKNEGIHSWVVWDGDNKKTKYKERFF
jgi:uncharacterized iron-regulated membrane protein